MCVSHYVHTRLTQKLYHAWNRSFRVFKTSVPVKSLAPAERVPTHRQVFMTRFMKIT